MSFPEPPDADVIWVRCLVDHCDLARLTRFEVADLTSHCADPRYVAVHRDCKVILEVIEKVRDVI